MHPLLDLKQDRNISLKSYKHSEQGPFVQQVRRIKYQQGPTFNKRILCVCEKCKNEWMNTFEKAVQKQLTSMIKGERVCLSPSDRQQIATWLCFKAMVLEQDDRDTMATTQNDRDFIYENKSPPPNWFVLISPMNSEEWHTRFRHYGIGILPYENGQKPALRHNAQVTNIGLGKALTQTISHYDDFSKFCVEAFATRSGHTILWPADGKALNWPTKTVLNDRGAEDFASEFVLGIATLHS